MHKRPMTKVAAYMEANRASLKTEAAERLAAFANTKVKEFGLAIKTFKYTFPFHSAPEQYRAYVKFGKLFERYLLKKIPAISDLLPHFFTDLGTRAQKWMYVLFPVGEGDLLHHRNTYEMSSSRQVRALGRYFTRILNRAIAQNIIEPGVLVSTLSWVDVTVTQGLRSENVKYWALKIEIMFYVVPAVKAIYNLFFYLNDLVKILETIYRICASEAIQNADRNVVLSGTNPQPIGASPQLDTTSVPSAYLR